MKKSARFCGQKLPQEQENQCLGEESFVFYSPDKRLISLSGYLGYEAADKVALALLEMEKQNPGKPILFLINSYGGNVTCALKIYGHIRNTSSPVTTRVCGAAASGALLIFLAGDKREIFQDSLVRFHWVILNIEEELNPDSVRGKADYTNITYAKVMEIIRRHSNLADPQIEGFCRISKALTAKEALGYKLADEMIFHTPKPFSVKNRKGKKEAGREKMDREK